VLSTLPEENSSSTQFTVAVYRNCIKIENPVS